MKNVEVIQSLQNAVIAAVAASTAPALPIAFIDTIFERPNDNKYIEIIHITNNNDTVVWGDQMRYAGILRLILHWPKSDSGVYPPTRLLESIMSHFIKERRVGDVQITTSPNFAGSIANDSEILYPASVRYALFA